MSMPFYVAPEQVMKDRADYARKGIAHDVFDLSDSAGHMLDARRQDAIRVCLREGVAVRR